MNKLLVTLFAALTIASIGNAMVSYTPAKPDSYSNNNPLLSKCHVLKRIRTATMKKLQELDKKAQDGDIASGFALYAIHGICKAKHSFFVSGKTEEILKEMEFINNKGGVSTVLCECISEEVYEECKDVFEADEK